MSNPDNTTTTVEKVFQLVAAPPAPFIITLTSMNLKYHAAGMSKSRLRLRLGQPSTDITALVDYVYLDWSSTSYKYAIYMHLDRILN